MKSGARWSFSAFIFSSVPALFLALIFQIRKTEIYSQPVPSTPNYVLFISRGDYSQQGVNL